MNKKFENLFMPLHKPEPPKKKKRINKKILSWLANFLEVNSDILMKTKRFTMYDYKVVEPESSCGTSHCALGWLRLLYYGKTEICLNEDYDPVGMLIGSDLNNMGHTYTHNSLMWQYLFGSFWDEVKPNNTPADAAERIRFVVKHKTYPQSFFDEYVHKEQRELYIRQSRELDPHESRSITGLKGH